MKGGELTAWWSARTEREQRLLVAGGVAALVLLLLAVIMPLQRSLGGARMRVADKQSALAWIRSVEPRLAAAPQAISSGSESLVSVVNRSAQAAGIASALKDSASGGNGALRVRFDGVAFDNLAAWLAQLTQNYGVRITSATITGQQSAGAVSATLVLTRN